MDNGREGNKESNNTPDDGAEVLTDDVNTGLPVKADNTTGKRANRPMGNKAAKKKKQEDKKREKGGVSNLETSASQMAASIEGLQSSYSESQEKKNKIAEQKLHLDRTRLDWKMSKLLLSKKSTAT